MLLETVRDCCEPRFESPPRLAVPRERRLTVLAARASARDGSTHAFRDNALSLAVADDGAVSVTAQGDAVAGAFRLAPGPLAGPPESLAAVLHIALARARDGASVTPFEAAVATRWAACVLLRGVVLPTDGGADVVLSWKAVLDADATARIRTELLREMRVSKPRPGPIAAFA